ncbi:MAG: hypothetical protein RMK32_01900 [Anaerolineae bacterium]|nr:hypothetical protein [Thermoflexus sp.]MDW8064369.1 hypothetical protein [Anaerolineae bacterium]
MKILLQALEILLRPYRQFLVVGSVAFVLGLASGLIYGWYIAPVEWIDAAPVDLRVDYRENYLRLLADAVRAGFLSLEDSADWLGQRWNPRDAAREIRRLAQTETDPARRDTMERLGEVWEQIPLPPAPAQRGGILFPCLIGLAVLVLVGIGGFWLLRRPFSTSLPRRLAPPPAPKGPPAAPLTPERPAPGEAYPATWLPPLSQHQVTYKLGDDHFDLSFALELPNGEFLGEYGVSISETIGVGDPAKVTAFEVWLFDKNDIKTVTKVLASEYAYRDAGLQARLRQKGDLMLASPGAILEIETRDLRLRARVVEMEYGTGALPPNSFFTRLTVDLAAWRKQENPS